MERNDASRFNWIRYSEWALWFNAISAVFGGGFLLGGAGSMPMWFLDTTPFSSFAIPGAILLVIVGGSSLLAATSRVRRWSNQYQLTLVAGVVLLGWIMVEFILIPQGWMAQMVYAAVALPMIAGGLTGRRATSMVGYIQPNRVSGSKI